MIYRRLFIKSRPVALSPSKFLACNTLYNVQLYTCVQSINRSICAIYTYKLARLSVCLAMYTSYTHDRLFRPTKNALNDQTRRYDTRATSSWRIRGEKQLDHPFLHYYCTPNCVSSLYAPKLQRSVIHPCITLTLKWTTVVLIVIVRIIMCNKNYYQYTHYLCVILPASC